MKKLNCMVINYSRQLKKNGLNMHIITKIYDFNIYLLTAVVRAKSNTLHTDL